MNSHSDTFTIVFLCFLFLTLGLKLWINSRHIRHILRHRGQTPPEFAHKISLEAHQKAAAYTIAKTKLGLILMFINACVLLGFTIFGGLQWLSVTMLGWFGPGYLYQIGLVFGFSFLTALIDLPGDYYNQFVLEEKFGFNKMGLGLWLRDLFAHTALGVALGLPLLWAILYLMAQAGSLWWLYAWLVFTGFMLFMQIIFPTFIAPLFNKFTPLEEGELRQSIEGLMQRTGFTANGLFVVDGSKRSAHSNAYFAGLGAKKRVVFYDTLIAQLSQAEIIAVLAHELGHFKLRHVLKLLAMTSLSSLAFFFVLGWLKDQVWFYQGLGVQALPVAHVNDAMALLLFMLVLPVFTFALQPLLSRSSRKHEYEADAFAAQHASADDLISSLVKMYEENAATLTPDPIHSMFYDSHPPAALRIAHLRAQA
ncbi:M48 family metallopeptidase [Massilia sp. W12]|uniref:M48 family metallopeptidase n=1 Tax=Massilia sp. W12 TaxID=3126507 RepID=UPI0030D5C306